MLSIPVGMATLLMVIFFSVFCLVHTVLWTFLSERFLFGKDRDSTSKDKFLDCRLQFYSLSLGIAFVATFSLLFV